MAQPAMVPGTVIGHRVSKESAMSVSTRLIALVAALAITATTFVGPAFAAPTSALASVATVVVAH